MSGKSYTCTLIFISLQTLKLGLRTQTRKVKTPQGFLRSTKHDNIHNVNN